MFITSLYSRKISICECLLITLIVQDFTVSYNSEKLQPPHFARLESLTVNKEFDPRLTGDKIIEIVEHLLQNTTPMPTVNITEIYENHVQYYRCFFSYGSAFEIGFSA